MKNMTASLQFVKTITHVLRKLSYTDTALFSLELLRIAPQLDHRIKSIEKLTLIIADDQISDKQVKTK